MTIQHGKRDRNELLSVVLLAAVAPSETFCIFRLVESEQEAGTVAGEDGPETQARHGASLRQLPPGSGRGGGQTSGGRGGQLSGLS